ncbi:hypothetical protein BGZ70_005487 [Mortierella alpina]|uniref:FHA domain-containing protein n=1 Tax=Mortierella alpina TaxID=64518 RepID=A0A9P6J9H0_MORAP|nr:hypothetical protein BGZ70_005487 [Mortierella alpina]
MTTRRNSPPIPDEKKPSLTRSRASSSSLASVSSINSLSGLLSTPSTTTAAATTTGSSTAVLSSAASSSSALNQNLNGTYTNSTSTTTTTTTATTTAIPAGSSSSNQPAATSSTYYPAFPYRNKSRTPSVSSTSTITQPVHNLLQFSSGILPKRHALPSVSTASATAALSLASPTLSATSVSSSSSSSSPPADSKYSTMNGSSSSDTPTNPILVLEPINNNFAPKSLDLQDQTRIKIGRQTGVATAPAPSNGYFDSKVLSRVHAEVWSENGKVFLRDLKSSNGTFLNGKRLSPESVESEPFVLNQNDNLEFGIDIMDENGALLHEKVACKIYISRMSYPTPGGSPQDSYAKAKASSPTGTGPSSKSSTSTAQGGQSANIDLIISRLQNELTRSQETNANLGVLKHGLGELEKAIVVSAKENGKAGSPQATEALVQVANAVKYEELIEQNTQAHAIEIAKMTKMLEETQAELDAYIQKTRLLEPLVAEDEILRRDLTQTSAELTSVKLERDFAKDSMNDLINEHQQTMESLRKEQESALAVLESTHKENLERVAREAALAQELLILKHQEDLAQALKSATAPSTTSESSEEMSSLKAQLSQLQAQVVDLQTAAKTQAEHDRQLTAEKAAMALDLLKVKEENATLIKELKALKEAAKSSAHDPLSTLTPTSPTNTTSTLVTQEQNGHGQTSTKTTTTTTTTASGSTKRPNGVVSKHETSWTQFIFMAGKKDSLQLNQPSTLAMSGGAMLVGIGAYVFWKSGSN